jgi:hypothetical protein
MIVGVVLGDVQDAQAARVAVGRLVGLARPRLVDLQRRRRVCQQTVQERRQVYSVNMHAGHEVRSAHHRAPFLRKRKVGLVLRPRVRLVVVDRVLWVVPDGGGKR